MEGKNRTYYYKTFQDDIVKSKNQDYKLKENYKWIKNNIIYRMCSDIIYGIAYVVSFFYCKFLLHMKIKNSSILKKYKKQGYFLYANHTQPIGDAFMPAHVCVPKRTYVVVSTANFGVPLIGRVLPMLGALPIPKSIKNTKKLLDAIQIRIKQKKCVVIYPEAHVWPYYTKIRPFNLTSFKFPVESEAVSFCMTTTYHKRKFGKKPKIVVYVDGPFVASSSLSKKENEEKLSSEIYNCMKNRCKESSYEYIKYEKLQ